MLKQRHFFLAEKETVYEVCTKQRYFNKALSLNGSGSCPNTGVGEIKVL